MHKLMVITNPDAAVGFSLAGVDVITARSSVEARKELALAINDDSAGIIAMDEDYFAEIDDALRAKTERMYRPIVVPIPSELDLSELGHGHQYLSAFIKRAVGFDIQLKS
ncbi:MAG TPA: V-type ATP synthase subunit F [Actinobacteria bacterium]|nr:V-type ATP synthase subunit F [Actinomycetota bacterium]